MKLATVGKRIDEIRRGYEQALADAGNDYERGCIVACGLIDLRQAVKEYLPVLKQLQGSKLGFLTDRDPGNWKNDPPYPDQVLIDCAIEAVMRGARWTGNEMNILAGGVYLTKEFWWRKVTEIVGLTDLDLVPGIPEVVGPKALVGFVATWRLDGKPMSISRRFSVSVRKGQGDDATIGKAEARMLKAIYRKLTGTDVSDAGEEETAAPASAPRPAIAAKVKCDGDHAMPRCGAAPGQCWHDDPPEDDASGEVFDWSAGDDAAKADDVRAKMEATK